MFSYLELLSPLLTINAQKVEEDIVTEIGRNLGYFDFLNLFEVKQKDKEEINKFLEGVTDLGNNWDKYFSYDNFKNIAISQAPTEEFGE